MKKTRRINLILVILACAAVLAACGAYLVYNYVYFPRHIAAENRKYAAMYEPETTASPAASPVSQPVLDAEATLAPAAPEDVQLGTPGPDTIIYAASTLPPVQPSFTDLILFNPETAGFLTLGENDGLPVVQKEGDNEYYLTHSFDNSASDAGCLFIDGANWLFPQDECLYVYGHNMKNGEMFGRLTRMSTVDGLVARSPVYFDTIYEDGVYIPFACFALSADNGDNDYFNLRRFEFTAESFAEYVKALKSHSTLDIPVDATYGDKLLVLVTCNYSINDGRFVVACRKLRENETIDGAMRLVKLAAEK